MKPAVTPEHKTFKYKDYDKKCES